MSVPDRGRGRDFSRYWVAEALKALFRTSVPQAADMAFQVLQLHDVELVGKG